MHINIKEATVDDVAEIVKTEQACFASPWTAQGVRESIENEHTHLYLALADGEVAGYMGVQIFSGEGYVTNVAVLPAYRRKGIATALLERALKNEMEFLTLEVRESNRAAIALYEKMGFHPVGRRPKFYSTPTEDALLMTKDLI